MFTKSRMMTLLVALAFVFVLAGAAAQQATTVEKTTKDKPGETITCPVSGEPANAKISWEYKGKTYYFCCEGCKAKFMKDPESFLQKKVEGQPAAGMDVYVCPMCHDAKSENPGKCPKCGMDLVKMEHGKDVFIKKLLIEGPEPGQGRMMMYGPFMGHQEMMGRGLRMHRGLMGGCSRMMMKDVDLKVEDTKDGVVITLTSKDADTVKILQGHAAMLKKRHEAKCSEECEPKKDVIIKKEVIKK